MNEKLLLKILESDLGRETKEKIFSYWLLPSNLKEDSEVSAKAPIQKKEGRVGSVRRPSREKVYLKDHPKAKEEKEAMEETIEEVTKEDEK